MESMFVHWRRYIELSFVIFSDLIPCLFNFPFTITIIISPFLFHLFLNITFSEIKGKSIWIYSTLSNRSFEALLIFHSTSAVSMVSSLSWWNHVLKFTSMIIEPETLSQILLRRMRKNLILKMPTTVLKRAEYRSLHISQKK